MTERKNKSGNPESKGEFLGTWSAEDGLKTLANSVCKVSRDVSNDSDSYTSEWESKSSSNFSPGQISRAARHLDHLKVGRYSKSLVHSYEKSYSWGGCVSSSSGPVSQWNSGSSKGFEVDGIDIKLSDNNHER